MWNPLTAGALASCFLSAPANLPSPDGQHGLFLSSWRIAEEKAPKIPIGVCWMEDDGTIVLDLRRTADGINISMKPRRYRATDPDYGRVLEHVGPLRPGEVKPVMPWPD